MIVGEIQQMTIASLNIHIKNLGFQNCLHSSPQDLSYQIGNGLYIVLTRNTVESWIQQTNQAIKDFCNKVINERTISEALDFVTVISTYNLEEGNQEKENIKIVTSVKEYFQQLNLNDNNKNPKDFSQTEMEFSSNNKNLFLSKQNFEKYLRLCLDPTFEYYQECFLDRFKLSFDFLFSPQGSSFIYWNEQEKKFEKRIQSFQNLINKANSFVFSKETKIFDEEKLAPRLIERLNNEENFLFPFQIEKISQNKEIYISQGYVYKKLNLNTNSKNLSDQWRFFHQQTIEIFLTKSLHHPKIISFFGIILTKDYVFLILERGQKSLEEVLPKTIYPKLQIKNNNRILTNKQKIKIMEDIICGVKYLHENGVVHRDLKPGNIIINQYENKIEAKLIDFGISSIVNQDDQECICKLFSKKCCYIDQNNQRNNQIKANDHNNSISPNFSNTTSLNDSSLDQTFRSSINSYNHSNLGKISDEYLMLKEKLPGFLSDHICESIRKTPQYAPPEVDGLEKLKEMMKNESFYSIDIWSLLIVFGEIILNEKISFSPIFVNLKTIAPKTLEILKTSAKENEVLKIIVDHLDSENPLNRPTIQKLQDEVMPKLYMIMITEGKENEKTKEETE